MEYNCKHALYKCVTKTIQLNIIVSNLKASIMLINVHEGWCQTMNIVSHVLKSFFVIFTKSNNVLIKVIKQIIACFIIIKEII